MEQHLTWHHLGFGFQVEQREDGSQWIKVTDPWFNKADGDPTPGLTLRLQPYASYADAKEIANFLNNHLLCGTTPILSLMEGR